jgi:hypothetical protein
MRRTEGSSERADRIRGTLGAAEFTVPACHCSGVSVLWRRRAMDAAYCGDITGH